MMTESLTSKARRGKGFRYVNIDTLYSGFQWSCIQEIISHKICEGTFSGYLFNKRIVFREHKGNYRINERSEYQV